MFGLLAMPKDYMFTLDEQQLTFLKLHRHSEGIPLHADGQREQISLSHRHDHSTRSPIAGASDIQLEHARLAQSVERETLNVVNSQSQGCGFDPRIGLFLYQRSRLSGVQFLFLH